MITTFSSYMFLHYYHVCEYVYISYVLSKNPKLKIHITIIIYVVLYADEAFITYAYTHVIRRSGQVG
jgi:hypothetical protein